MINLKINYFSKYLDPWLLSNRFRAVMSIGVLCAVISLLWRIMSGFGTTNISDVDSDFDIFVLVFLVIFVAPLGESIIFLIPFILLRKIHKMRLVFFLFLMFWSGWWLHGGGWENIGRGFLFGILGYLTYIITASDGLRVGMVANICAHSVANLFAIIFAISIAPFLQCDQGSGKNCRLEFQPNIAFNFS